MAKKLADYSLEKLWELFPIVLVEHKAEWINFYNDEEQLIKDRLDGKGITRISHIGSTAIQGIHAKPTVDILVEIHPEKDMYAVAVEIEDMGYMRMTEQTNRISFNKGYTIKGYADRVYHLYLRYKGDNDELYFRDYMNSYEECAKGYEKLKLSLLKKYEHDRDGYTEAKTKFVRQYTEKARKEYEGRY